MILVLRLFKKSLVYGETGFLTILNKKVKLKIIPVPAWLV